jgi:hypothetical protein
MWLLTFGYPVCSLRGSRILAALYARRNGEAVSESISRSYLLLISSSMTTYSPKAVTLTRRDALMIILGMLLVLLILFPTFWKPTILIKPDNCTIRPDFMNGANHYELFCK